MILGEYNYSKGSNKKVKVKCDNCGKIFEKPYRNVIKSNQHSCCKECNIKLKQEKALKEFESKIGEEAYTYLKREYIDNKRTTRQISKDVYGTEKNSPNIASWIKKLGIELRHGSEAIKTQWINNSERRKQASETAKIILCSEENRKKLDEFRASKGYRIVRQSKIRMTKDEFHKFLSDSRKGSGNPMYGRRGKLSPRWNPNRSHDQRIQERKTFEYAEWRKSVFDKDDYTCQCCGDNKGGNLVAHHLNSYHEHKEERYKIENGITLCEKCHKEFHHIYGYGNNTKEQYEQFINDINTKLRDTV